MCIRDSLNCLVLMFLLDHPVKQWKGLALLDFGQVTFENGETFKKPCPAQKTSDFELLTNKSNQEELKMIVCF